VFVKVVGFSAVGSQFLFGDLAKNSFSDTTAAHKMGFIFAFQVLPNIIFFSTISAGLFYFGILQRVTQSIAWVMSKTMRLSGAESLSAAGNIFLGQSEAPLLIKPFIHKMSQSELMCVMTVGMSTIAGAVMAAYISLLGGESTEMQTLFATHLLNASIMNVPAGIVMSKIIYPETEEIETRFVLSKDALGVNILDALSKGASDGLHLAINVGGMLLAFISVVALLNYVLGHVVGPIAGINEWVISSSEGRFQVLSFEYLLGSIFRFIAMLIGVEAKDSWYVGSLLGQKTVINEFVSYVELRKMIDAGLLSPHSITITTYALCGFSNFSSIAIQLGSLGTLAPNQKEHISRLGMRALLGASLACLATGAWAGIFADV
ncbi:MAG: NupC/NupG family nucleoside CNT transporter, partial [Cytophagales bacterium]|nr:NupC/NupG family nucleoside CNT transporter [Cytophagales bacterium]